MWIKSVRSDLLESLQLATKAVSTRSTLPILSGLYFEAKSDEVILYGTDLEITVIARFKSNVIEEGKTVIPAKTFLDIIRNLPEGVVEIKQGGVGNQVEITCEKNLFNLNTFNVEDFPKMPDFKEGKKIEFEANILNIALDKVVKSVSKDETRPVLTGVLFEGKRETLKLVATDSYRLSLFELKNGSFSGVEVIVPGRVLDEITRSTSKFEGKIQAFLGESEISFKMDGLPKGGEVTFASRLIEGQFPNYSQLIPKGFESEVYASRDELLQAIKRISVFSDNNPIKVEFTSEEGSPKEEKTVLKISTSSSELGSAYSEVEAEVKGKSGEIAFNPSFFLEGVEKIPGEKVFIGVQSSTKPALLKSVEGGSFLYLLMPVRIS
jgi:DNA polymerase-3 subunit beta